MRQNLTVNLERQTVLKAKILAARRGTSISALLGEQIEALVARDETYERAKAQALAYLDKGFTLGGDRVVDRAELHERQDVHRHERPRFRSRRLTERV